MPAGIDYQMMGLRLVGGSNLLSGSGAFYIDNIHAEYTEVNTSVDQIKHQDNTNRKTIENGYLNILFNGVKYNAEGKIIK